MDLSNHIVELITVAIGFIMTGIKTIKFVQEGELGIRLRFGRATRDSSGKPKIIQPGFVLMIPWVDALQRHHVRQQTQQLANQEIMIKDELIFRVSAVVFFRVKDIYRALFEISNLDHSISTLSMGILREVLAAKEYTELSHMEQISNELLHRLQEKAGEWGVEFLQFNLTDCAPTPQTAALVTVKVGIKMKLKALVDAAEEIGVDEIGMLHPAFAASLLGMTVVASADDRASSRATHRPSPENHAKKEMGTLRRLLGS